MTARDAAMRQPEMSPEESARIAAIQRKELEDQRMAFEALPPEERARITQERLISQSQRPRISDPYTMQQTQGPLMKVQRFLTLLILMGC
jgi:hypothetical protein